jgi:hypothetical protein
MREVPKDDKWQHEREANDARRDAYGVTDAADTSGTESGFAAGEARAELQAELISTAAEGVASQPSEHELVVVALLMRIYDVQMALLSMVNKEQADHIFDTHANGGHFNPQIFIPVTEDS